MNAEVRESLGARYITDNLVGKYCELIGPFGE
jgi:hypothetical protein